MSQETSDLLFSAGGRHFSYRFDFGRINLDAFVTDDESQEFTGPDSESALVRVQSELVLLQSDKQLLQVITVFFFSL